MNEIKKPSQDAAAAFMADAESVKPLDWKDWLHDTTRRVGNPDYLLEINGTPMLPKGGIAMVTGEAKRGKTQFLAALVSVLVSGKSFGTMKRLKAPGSVLWCDTEQSPHNLQNCIDRIFHQADIPDQADSQKHGLYFLALRPLSFSERVEVITQSIEGVRPQVVVIDGIRDLLGNFNDVEESAALVQWLMSTADAHPEITFISVLHCNPKDTKMRGHLGTELENKMQDKFVATKENGVFTIEHFSRDKEMPTPFTFCIDGHGYLSLSTITQASGATFDDADTPAILRRILPPEGMDYGELRAAFMKATKLSQKKATKALQQILRDTPPKIVQIGGRWYHPDDAESILQPQTPY